MALLSKPGARVCDSYGAHRGQDLLEDRLSRHPNNILGLDGVPTQHIINDIFIKVVSIRISSIMSS